jgi:hypothetical protein
MVFLGRKDISLLPVVAGCKAARTRLIGRGRCRCFRAHPRGFVRCVAHGQRTGSCSPEQTREDKASASAPRENSAAARQGRTAGRERRRCQCRLPRGRPVRAYEPGHREVQKRKRARASEASARAGSKDACRGPRLRGDQSISQLRLSVKQAKDSSAMHRTLRANTSLTLAKSMKSWAAMQRRSKSEKKDDSHLLIHRSCWKRRIHWRFTTGCC